MKKYLINNSKYNTIHSVCKIVINSCNTTRKPIKPMMDIETHILVNTDEYLDIMVIIDYLWSHGIPVVMFPDDFVASGVIGFDDRQVIYLNELDGDYYDCISTLLTIVRMINKEPEFDNQIKYVKKVYQYKHDWINEVRTYMYDNIDLDVKSDKFEFINNVL